MVQRIPSIIMELKGDESQPNFARTMNLKKRPWFKKK